MPRRLNHPATSQLPEFIPPELATLVDQPPEGIGWLHEIKLDGYRTAARVEGGQVRLLTRTGPTGRPASGRSLRRWPPCSSRPFIWTARSRSLGPTASRASRRCRSLCPCPKLQQETLTWTSCENRAEEATCALRTRSTSPSGPRGSPRGSGLSWASAAGRPIPYSAGALDP